MHCVIEGVRITLFFCLALRRNRRGLSGLSFRQHRMQVGVTRRIGGNTRQFLRQAGDGLARGILRDRLNLQGLNTRMRTDRRILINNPTNHVFT